MSRVSMTVAVAVVLCVPFASVDAQWEVRIGGASVMSSRNASFAGSTTSSSGTAQGIDLLARTEWIGLSVRSTQTGLGGSLTLITGDARLLLGPQWLTVEAGLVRRAIAGSVSSTAYGFSRAGLRSTVALGGSGLRATFAGAALLQQQVPTGVTASGIDAETGLIYMVPKFPLYVQVGYRREVFTITDASGKRPEESGGLALGAGLVFGAVRPR